MMKQNMNNNNYICSNKNNGRKCLSFGKIVTE